MRFNTIIFIIIGLLLFILCMFGLFEPSIDPTGFFVYTPRIAVFNPSNSQPVNNSLEISFMTRGTNDLIITPLKGSMKILELRCGSQIVGKGSSKYKDYKCRDKSTITVKVLSKEVKIGLRFGRSIQQAENIAPDMPRGLRNFLIKDFLLLSSSIDPLHYYWSYKNFY